MQIEKLMELGSRLKGRRTELGLEREEVAIKLKVSAKTLYALEEALSDSLPQPIFARGFVRSYAKIMNMDLTELDELINEAFPATSMDNINPELSSTAREQSITINQTSNTKVILLAALVVLLLLGLIGFIVYQFWGDDIKDAVNRPAVTTSGVGTPGAVPPPRAVQQRPGPVADSPAPAATAPAEAAATAAPAVPAEPRPNAEAQALQDAQNVIPPRPADYPPNLVTQSNSRADTPIPAGTMRVVLFAKYECWVGAEFDEYGRRSFTLEPGQIFVLDFKTKLRLTLGNAGGIDMSYNGQPYDTGGRFKESKVLNFPPQ